MTTNADSPLDLLWKEYSSVFRDFDDMTLARWLAQTLGQLEGRAWRLSHPLLGAYRLASQLAHERQIWLKRLANPPPNYCESHCCRAPMLPLLTRDVHDAGLICQHCSDTLVAFEEIPVELKAVWNPGPRNTAPSTASPTGTIGSARAPVITTVLTKRPRRKPNDCWPAPAASWRLSCWNSIPLWYGKIRMNALK